MLYFLLLPLTVVGIQNFDEKALLTINSVKCNVNDRFAFKNFTCFAKSYSRTISTFNVKLYFKEPLDKVFVS